MKTITPIVLALALYLLGASERSQSRRWQYATLTMNHFTGVWDFHSDDKTISEDSNKEGDKILKGLGGTPYADANPQYGSGFSPILQQIGRQGYEMVAVKQDPSGTVDYYFKKTVD